MTTQFARVTLALVCWLVVLATISTPAWSNEEASNTSNYYEPFSPNTNKVVVYITKIVEVTKEVEVEKVVEVERIVEVSSSPSCHEDQAWMPVDYRSADGVEDSHGVTRACRSIDQLLDFHLEHLIQTGRVILVN